MVTGPFFKKEDILDLLTEQQKMGPVPNGIFS